MSGPTDGPPAQGRPGASPEAFGTAAALGAATIWGATLALTRLGVTQEEAAFGPHDMVLLRFAGPAVLLLPVAWRSLKRLRDLAAARLLTLLAGGGAPFVLMVGTGLQQAGSADAGALLPGTLPLWVAAASLLAGQQGPALEGRQVLGLALMALAVPLVAGPALLAGDAWLGTGLLLLAAWLAAGYTLALRQSGLAPLEATALVSLASLLAFLPLYLFALEPALPRAHWADVVLQAAWQGGVSGIAAPVAFAFAALSPLAAALLGLVLMGEAPEGLAAAGLLASAAGVALSAGSARHEAR
jgi:drug/metabolite transporter (DMT)-like permease